MFPFVEGAYLSLNNAFNWAEKHGVGIWIDFHAHNGSQNGYTPRSHPLPDRCSSIC